MSARRKNQITFLVAPILAATLTACIAVVEVPFGAPKVAPRPWPAQASCPMPARSAADQARTLALLNGERAKAGLPPLRASAAVASVAHHYACELATRPGLSHTGADGSTLRERLARGGVASSLVAENLAAGQRSADQVVAAWMASPGHRANILRPEVTTMGLGQADGALPLWVLDLTS